MARAKSVYPNRSYANVVGLGGHQRNEVTRAGPLELRKTGEVSISALALARAEANGAKQKESPHKAAQKSDCRKRSTTQAVSCFR